VSGVCVEQIAARLDRIPASRTLWRIVVAAFICGAMLLAIGAIAFFGPSTRGIALEQLND
jgi:hypothetical protein